MKWMREAAEDLRRYPRQKESLGNIQERIKALQQEYQSVKCAMGNDSVPVKGGSSRIEDRMLNNIVERQKLTYTYRATKLLVSLVERGLAGLDEKERLVLERFYISPSKGNVARLMSELGYEQRQVYNIKDEALYRFTMSMYGLIDY